MRFLPNFFAVAAMLGFGFAPQIFVMLPARARRRNLLRQAASSAAV